MNDEQGGARSAPASMRGTSIRAQDQAVLRPGSNTSRQTVHGGGSEERLAQALGWFSLGLGLAGLAAPGEVARMIGVRDDHRNRELLRMVGVREVVSGLGILSQPRPAGWLWSRVAGDMMDLSLLGKALTEEETQKDRAMAATAAIAGIAALDLYCSQKLTVVEGGQNGSQHGGPLPTLHRGGNGVQKPEAAEKKKPLPQVRTITIRKSPEEVYAFWRDFRNLPRFMRHLEAVEVLDERRSHWKVQGPAGTTVEWDAEIVEDRPNELIAWRTLPGAMVQHSGHVHFRQAPGDRGTEVRVELQYVPPAGALGDFVAKLFGRDPAAQGLENLRTFKQVMETGEVVRSDASTTGTHFPQREAQPISDLSVQRNDVRKLAA